MAARTLLKPLPMVSSRSRSVGLVLLCSMNTILIVPLDTVDKILDRFLDVGFQDFEVVWLLSAHTVAAADRVDDTIPRTPFDSTPEIFDTQFFIETQLRGQTFPGVGGVQGEVTSPLRGEMRLQSDHLLARDSRTACEWQSFTNDQEKFAETFPDVMSRLALLGVDQSQLIDCSEVIPIAPPLPASARPHFPAGKTSADVEQAVRIVIRTILAVFADFVVHSSALRLRSRPSPLTPVRLPPSPPCKLSFSPLETQ